MQNPNEITRLKDVFNLLPFMKSYKNDKSPLQKQISDLFGELIDGCKLQPSRWRPNAFLVEQLALSEEHEENEEHNQRFSPDLLVMSLL